MKKIVVACLTADDVAVVHQLARGPSIQVIAVVFDLGDGARLRELHDQVVEAGAARCHVMDVRDDYARGYLLPALQQQCGEQEPGFVGRLARACMTDKLAQIAAFEGAEVVHPVSRVASPEPFAVKDATQSADGAAQVAIAFENRVPVAVNDVPMSLVEVLELLATIGAAHGVGGHGATETLQRAYDELAQAPHSSRVSLTVGHGEVRPARAYATS